MFEAHLTVARLTDERRGIAMGIAVLAPIAHIAVGSQQTANFTLYTYVFSVRPTVLCAHELPIYYRYRYRITAVATRNVGTSQWRVGSTLGLH